MVARLLKTLVRRSTAAMAPAVWRMRREPRVVVLLYHRVLPRGHEALSTEQPGMYVHPDTLEANIGWLRRYWEIVDLDDWVQAAASGMALPQRAAAITFDDGWADNHEFALPVLVRQQAPATIYVCPGLVSDAGTFWPTRMARLFAHGMSPATLAPSLLQATLIAGVGAPDLERGLDRDQIDRVIVACKRYADRELHAWLDIIDGDGVGQRQYRDLMDWPEMREMQASGCVRFGSHTRRHLRLTGASAAEIESEIAGSHGDLTRELGEPIRSFAYPNGDTTPEAITVAARCYQAAVTTRRGMASRGSHRWTLPRIGMHQGVAGSRSGFLARLAGVG